MSFIIRRAEESDIGEIVDICTTAKENTFNTPELPPRDLADIIKEGGSFVCCEGRKIIGVGLAEDNGFVFALYVRPEWDNKGIGKKLLNTMLYWIHEKGVSQAFLVTAPGTKADKFYEKHGWVRGNINTDGERVYYYALTQTPAYHPHLNVEF